MLHIYFFGIIQVFHNGFILPPFITHKALSLFVYLVMNSGKTLEREFLAEMFWPNRSEVQARRSLHTALWHIRKSLKAARVPLERYLIITKSRVTWVRNSDDWLDVEAFEKSYNSPDMQERKYAVQLYRGNLFAQLNDDWCIEERSRLCIHYLEALKSLIESCFTINDFVSAVDYSHLMISVDPLNEDANRGMIYALHQLGNRAGMIEHYRSFTNLLRKEIGILPSEETRRLYQQIIDGLIPQVKQPSLVMPIANLADKKSSGNDGLNMIKAPLPLPCMELFERGFFVGRGPEMKILNRWWVSQPEIIAQVKGYQGSGKTRLIQEFTTILKSQNILVGWSRCFAFSQRFPYQVLSDTFQNLLESTPATLREKIPGQIINRLMQVDLRLDENPGEMAIAWMKSSDQQPIFGAFLDLLTYLAQFFPIIIVIEDLHWANANIQQLLEYLIRYLQNHPVNGRQPIRFLTSISLEMYLPDYIISMDSCLHREGLVQDLSLKDLGREAIEQWIHDWCGGCEKTDMLANQLFLQAGGNALLTIETVKAGLSTGYLRLTNTGWEGTVVDQECFPVSNVIRSLIEDRLNSLSLLARQVLQAASIIGVSFDLTTLSQILGVDEGKLLEVLEELLHAHLIQESQKDSCNSCAFIFKYPIIHQAVYDQVSQARKVILNRKLLAQKE